MKKLDQFAWVVVAALAAPPCAMAGVSAADAARLKGDLTPFGAEKAGNKEGTIPAWTGGVAQSTAAAFINGKTGRRADPFKDEKPLYTVTAKNMDQHASKLTDGVKALLKRYPDTYRLDVYQTHRTAAAPQWVYDNTFKNATRGKLDNNIPKDVYGGIPFPIPSSGAEAIWNHMLRFRPTTVRYRAHGIQVTSDGQRVQQVDGYGDFQEPYYDPAGSLETFNGVSGMVRITSMGPPIHAGELLVAQEYMDASKSRAWLYLVGQRRVRKLPNACCDTPASPSAGVTMTDEEPVWLGRIDRFEWKIIGKQEMLIPYNSNRTLAVTKDVDLVGPRHINPDHLRWELHRVWVLEATLAPGQRHQAPRNRYYLDEDTWSAVLGDRWDSKGQLWRSLWVIPYVAPDIPAVLMSTNGMYDLLSGGYFASNVLAEITDQWIPTSKFKDTYFTPEAMVGEGVR